MVDLKKKAKEILPFFTKNEGYRKFLKVLQKSHNSDLAQSLNRTKLYKRRKLTIKKGIQLTAFLIVLLSQPALACFKQASVTYNIPVPLLRAIAIVESSNNPNAINISNKNGTRDIGLMQINSQWLKRLTKYGISEKDLYDPCQNILVSAWILRQKLNKYGYSWQGIGTYNSSKPKPNLKYAWKIFKALDDLK